MVGMSVRPIQNIARGSPQIQWYFAAPIPLKTLGRVRPPTRPWSGTFAFRGVAEKNTASPPSPEMPRPEMAECLILIPSASDSPST